MFRAAFLRQVPLFIRDFAENVLLCLCAAGVEATASRIVADTTQTWRKALTDRLQARYFQGMTYYKLSYVDRSVSHPEQRLAEDIPKLCDGLGAVLHDAINAAVDACVYSVVLRSYSRSHKYTASIVAYILLGGGAVVAASPNFGRLMGRQAAAEGAYRAAHARLRAHAESVAFYRGVAVERAHLEASFADLVRAQAAVIHTQWRFGMWQDFATKYLAATVAVVLIIGPFFQGHLRPGGGIAGRASMLASMRYHTNIIISLFTSLGSLAQTSHKLARLTAHADRVAALEAAADAVCAGKGGGGGDGATGRLEAWEGGIEFSHADVITPTGEALVRDLCLRVPRGTNLLVTGPNGSGKSSLFRVLGGLWPLASGTVRKPGGAAGGLAADIFYVPQRPYVTAGTLEDQIIYPTVRAPGAPPVIPPRDLRALLAQVDLGHLADREAAALASGAPPLDWGSDLSLGEQQRLGMARLFYHRPAFAILDECTSGVTSDMEARFCAGVRAMGCTCITISHRPALVAFHDLVLALDGEGGWSVHAGARVVEEGGAAGAADALGVAAGRAADGSARAAAAGDCLAGMTAAAGASPTRGVGAGAGEGGARVGRELARAPPASIHSALVATTAPSAAALLAPSTSTPLSERWRTIGSILFGKGRGRGQLAAIVGVVAARSLLQDRMAALNGRTVEYVLRQDKPAFIRLIGLSVAQAAASAVLAPSLRAVGESLALAWRRSLTASIHALYLRRINFYAVSSLGGMADVDARVTDDVARLATDLAALIPCAVKPVFDLAWFSARLYALTGGRGMLLLYAYAALGFTALRALTPDFGGMAREGSRLESAFRGAHARLRAHAESVAFFGGGPREAATVGTALSRLLAHARTVSTAKWAHAVADDFFARQLPHNVTWALTVLYALDHAPADADAAGQGRLVNDMRYLAGVVTACFASFGELLALHKRLAELGGGVARVGELLEAAGRADALHTEAGLHAAMRASLDGVAAAAATAAAGSTSLVPSPSGRSLLDPAAAAVAAATASISFSHVDITTPAGGAGPPLARALTFAVTPGRSLLVTGPNGSGKTSIIRLLGGLWPLAPCGAITRPGPLGDSGDALDTPDVFVVPQRPYSPPGSLRDQVVYPLSSPAAAARASADADPALRLRALDAKLDALMAIVRLGYLVDREGGWDADAEWGDVLSLGEQQRLGCARLFFHRPAFGVLDEATNATSVDVEAALYGHAAALGITLVTITQRAALLKHHAAVLDLVDGAGDWVLSQIVEEVGEEASPPPASSTSPLATPVRVAAVPQDEAAAASPPGGRNRHRRKGRGGGGRGE